MKEKRKQMVEVVVDICNICKKEVTNTPSSNAQRMRLPMINGLFKITDFHAHDGCINKIIRESFKEYL